MHATSSRSLEDGGVDSVIGGPSWVESIRGETFVHLVYTFRISATS